MSNYPDDVSPAHRHFYIPDEDDQVTEDPGDYDDREYDDEEEG